MTSPSRILFISMSIAFAVCILGLILGMLYSLYESFFLHKALETILSRSIPYYKALGLLGILGMLLFFVFLFFQIAGKGQPQTPLARPHHQMCRPRQSHALNFPEPRLAQPRGVLVLAVAAPLACSHQHIQCKQRRMLRRRLVRFQNEIADDDAPLRRQRRMAALQQITIARPAQACGKWRKRESHRILDRGDPCEDPQPAS